MARRLVIYFDGGFFQLRIKDKFADNALSFPTTLCCFRQCFGVSDKRLFVIFDKRFVVSDKCFVGKSRVAKLNNTRDGMPYSRPRFSLQNDKKIRLHKHRQ
jgi:hypothetical protein